MSTLVRPLVVVSMAVFLGAGAYSSITRPRSFGPDSRNYVNVADNLRKGRGLVQDTVGFGESRFPASVRSTQPFAVHGPVYPALIAALGEAGLPLERAALALAALAYAVCLWAGFRLTERLYDRRTAAWCLLMLVASYPMAFIARAAWAEALGIAFWLVSLLVLASRPAPVAPMRAALAGLLSGLAFATRYPLVVALPVGLGAFPGRGERRARWVGAAAFVAGFMLIGAPVVARNLAATGRLTGAARNASTESVRSNVLGSVEILFGAPFSSPDSSRERWPGPIDERVLQAALLAVAALPFAARVRREGWPLVEETFLAEGRHIVLLAFLGYVVFLIAVRSVLNFDPLDARLMSPAHVAMVIAWAALLGAGIRVRAPVLGLALAGLALAKTAPLAHRLATTPASDIRSARATTDRLRWVVEQARPDDLLIGEDSEDLAFHLGRSSLYFTHSPHMQVLTEDDVRVVRREGCASGRRVFLLLRRRPFRESAAWGPFVMDLAAGRLAAYPGITEEARWSDGLVYRVGCGASAGG